jgi:hypothetical protein
MMRGALLVCGTLFLFLGLYVVLSAPPAGEESDLEYASSIIVLATGDLAVGIAHREEVQLYSSQGDFLGAIPVDSEQGGIRLKALADGGFQAATVRNRRLYTFDSAFEIASQRDDFNGYASFGAHGQWEARSMQGDMYLLRDSRILRQSGSTTEVIVDHRRRFPLSGEPLAGLLLLTSGLAQIGIAVFALGRFRRFLFGAAKMKQPTWVSPDTSDGTGDADPGADAEDRAKSRKPIDPMG